VEPQFAGIFTMADEASVDGQRRQMRMLRFELGTVIVGAFLGAVDDRTTRVISAVAFVLAIVMRASRATSNPVADWHQGRAAAESVKTLCWRYAVCANPFGRHVDETEVDREFVQRLDDIMADLSTLRVMPPSDTADEQITTWMRETRASSLTERQDAYKVQRIDDQRHWYTAKAHDSAIKSQRWGLAVLLMECAGAAMAVVSLGNLSGFGPFGPGTLLGVIAAMIAAATAWTQAKQFGNLAAAYTIAHQELTSIRGLLARPMEDESQWGAFVDSAEGAISREHTMWRAARSGGGG
jgi:SMODS and SLOG-associating 2TM effector domain 3/SMODS and SLOG-associating 2TM effector domain 1